MTKFEINLPRQSYAVYTGVNILSMLGPVSMEEGLSGKVFLLSDTNVSALYCRHLRSSLENFGYMPEEIIIPSGEGNKNLKKIEYIYNRLFEMSASRDSVLFAVGGGMIGDVAGYAAATYMRGIRYVQVPTTLLAQVDSSIGGKVGVNLQYGKNLVGTFYHPRFVFIDVKTLSTLDDRQIQSGLAEVIKYGVILDGEFYKYVEKNIGSLFRRESDLYLDIVKKCSELKAGVVEKDEREEGYREILNFGHTAGHAIEVLGGYSKLTHGEAIIHGMIMEARVSLKLNKIGMNDYNRLVEFLKKLNPPPLPDNLTTDKLIEQMYADKKVRGGQLRFTLIEGIGIACRGVTIDGDILKEALLEQINEYTD